MESSTKRTFIRKKPKMYRGKRVLSRFGFLTKKNFFAESSRFSTEKYNEDPINRKDEFCRRHIGPNQYEQKAMLRELGLKDLEDLVAKTVPNDIIYRSEPNDFSPALEEKEILKRIKQLANRNEVWTSYVGTGYYGTVTPSVIQRNIFENPGWYTQYTPYQAEISQGRLESLLNFQTMITEITGMTLANCSLLDEATACAEAMTLCHRFNKKPVFIVDRNLHPQNIDVLRTRAEPLDIDVKIMDWKDADFASKTVSGIIVQYPNTEGTVEDFTMLVQKAHESGVLVVMATDLMALTLLKSPGDIGADIALGSAQRLGVPMGFGGPHAAFFGVKDSPDAKSKLLRLMPGRVVGVSKDSGGQQAYRLTLQTREQHIRRDKATSNICTAQALLANMSAMYAIYHGPSGLKRIANRIHHYALVLATGIQSCGHEIVNPLFFDTLKVKLNDRINSTLLKEKCSREKINLRYFGDHTNPKIEMSIGISLDETVGKDEMLQLLELFDCNISIEQLTQRMNSDTLNSSNLRRISPFLTHSIFNKFHSETQIMRYMKSLENKDISLVHSMIPLGSCTMKLNSSVQLKACSWPEFSQIHPFVPADQVEGYHEMIKDLEKWLCALTGYDKFSFQPNSGAQGEYTGLLAIRKYFRSIDQNHRNVCLIPVCAHGTNPASAQMAGMQIVVADCDQHGNVSMKDLETKAQKYADRLGAVMITYPSTHGVFESSVKSICQLIHDKGGQVYLDGANMNAQVGLCRPGDYGSDVSHLNLHKTFCIPHGGGGPGVGPVGVKKHLAPFLPSHHTLSEAGISNGAVSGAPFGSASILPVSWAYIAGMGFQGLRKATQVAILNANYMSFRLAPYYKTLYKSKEGFNAHEFIIDCKSFKGTANVEAADIAKRLMDYGFHAPTLSFPVSNCLMIEPTESESKDELDRFIDALISIRSEIADIEEGKYPQDCNLLKMAPHTLSVISSDVWSRPYSRTLAAYPLKSCRNKLWPSVGRVDDQYGDKHLFCTCPPVDQVAV